LGIRICPGDGREAHQAYLALKKWVRARLDVVGLDEARLARLGEFRF